MSYECGGIRLVFSRSLFEEEQKMCIFLLIFFLSFTMHVCTYFVLQLRVKAPNHRWFIVLFFKVVMLILETTDRVIMKFTV